MTDAQIGWGAEFHLDDASSVLTELGEITAISLPNPVVADVEATHFKSPNRRRATSDSATGPNNRIALASSIVSSAKRTSGDSGPRREARRSTMWR